MLVGNHRSYKFDALRIAFRCVAGKICKFRHIGQLLFDAPLNRRLDFLRRIQEQSPAAYDRIQYIEQPTHRDLEAHPENRMHEAAKLKPVVIDESLVDYESLLLAREQGYSGVALKACKGHTEALFAAAAAQKPEPRPIGTNTTAGSSPRAKLSKNSSQ